MAKKSNPTRIGDVQEHIQKQGIHCKSLSNSRKMKKLLSLKQMRLTVVVNQPPKPHTSKCQFRNP